MKTKNYLSLLALIAAALSLDITTATAQSVDSGESLKNSAFAASPRAKEDFPWLARSAQPRTAACCAVNELTAIRKNRAFAASPRALEQFPELARPVQALKTTDSVIASTVIKNRAFASSPRAKEEFPWLTRGNFKVTEEPFQIAPLK
jgi:hypothetical protein